MKHDSPILPFTLTSPAFTHLDPIPQRYTCEGENISPTLLWRHVPAGTKSLVLIMDDPDARGKTFVHWVLFNGSPALTMLPENETQGFILGNNDFAPTKNKPVSYEGPCPPQGVHHYRFRLYAVATKLSLGAGASSHEVMKAMQGQVMGMAELIGTYKRVQTDCESHDTCA